MKTITALVRPLGLALALAIGSFAAQAQMKTPQPSPMAKFTQTVGLTEISAEYSRPSAKGREIFGKLVPYNEMWRLGANANTMITFGDDVTVNGEALVAGTYAVFATPSEKSWTVIFYKNTENWGTPEKYDEALVALKTTAKVSTLPMSIETFEIWMNDLTNSSASLNFGWASTHAMLDIGVPTNDLAKASIEKTLAGPTFRDFYNAAKFYRTEKMEIKQAMTWIDMAAKGEGAEKFWVNREKALIQAEMGMYKEAIVTATTSKKQAIEAKYDSYVKMNDESIAEWSKMVKKK